MKKLWFGLSWILICSLSLALAFSAQASSNKLPAAALLAAENSPTAPAEEQGPGRNHLAPLAPELGQALAARVQRGDPVTPVLLLIASDQPAQGEIPSLSEELGSALQTQAPTADLVVNYLPSPDVWPVEARLSFEYAISIWETQITSPVPIIIDAEWDNLGGGALGGAMGYIEHNSPNLPYRNVWYPSALANRLAGRDLYSGSPDIYAVFNSAFPNWYYSTGETPPRNKWDFASVVLHEIAHGLGFGGSMSYGSQCSSSISNAGCWGYGLDPFIYDLYTVDGSGSSLINTGIYPNPSTALGQVLTSGKIYFAGKHAVQANNGGWVPLYSPATWAQGSSYVHVDEIYNDDPANALMTFSLPPGARQHSPGPITLGVLQDIGWSQPEVPTPTSTATMPPTPTPTPSPTPPPFDTYEADNTCATAKVLNTTKVQMHNFHQAGDEDWIYIDAAPGTTYVIDATSTHAHADLKLEIFAVCGAAPQQTGQNLYNLDARLILNTTVSQRYSLRITNTANVGGAQIAYSLSLRQQSPTAVALIVAGRNDDATLQNNIIESANRAYRTFLSAGLPKNQVRYLAPVIDQRSDADGDGSSDVYTTTTSAAVQTAIQTWATPLVSPQAPFYLYLVGHGGVDSFHANGSQDILTPTQLDGWLKSLETTRNAPVAVILEACRSGSFIDTPAGTPQLTLSRPGRVVIASTGSDLNAYASPGQGAFFSDAFFSALSQNDSLYSSYLAAVNTLKLSGMQQMPWLDDNGDGRPNGANDGDYARMRGFVNQISPNNTAPVIDNVYPVQLTAQGEASLQLHVREDGEVVQVWALIYPLPFEEPDPGTNAALDLTPLQLQATGANGEWHALFPFPAEGTYRILLFAKDAEGNISQPVVRTVCYEFCTIHMPVVRRR